MGLCGFLQIAPSLHDASLAGSLCLFMWKPVSRDMLPGRCSLKITPWGYFYPARLRPFGWVTSAMPGVLGPEPLRVGGE